MTLYAHTTDGTIDQIGALPALWLGPTRWHDWRGDPATWATQPADWGWLPVTEVPRPADTAETTSDPAPVALVDGVPTQQWTVRPWTAEELADRAEAAQHEADRLYEALCRLAQNFSGQSVLPEAEALPPVPPLRMLPREAFFAPARAVRFEASIGCIAAEAITFYPPGIPLLYPGEEITREILTYVRDMQRIGLKVVGPQDAALQTIRIIEAMEK